MKLGADVQGLDTAARSVTGSARRLHASVQSVDRMVRSLWWEGGDADRFRSSWTGGLRAKTDAALGSLDAAATDLRAQAEQQRRASDGAGGGDRSLALGYERQASGSTGLVGGTAEGHARIFAGVAAEHGPVEVAHRGSGIGGIGEEVITQVLGFASGDDGPEVSQLQVLILEPPPRAGLRTAFSVIGSCAAVERERVGPVLRDVIASFTFRRRS